HELPDMDRLARELAHDVHPDQRLVGHTDHELDEAVRKARDPRLRVCSERRAVGLAVEAAGSRFHNQHRTCGRMLALRTVDVYRTHHVHVCAREPLGRQDRSHLTGAAVVMSRSKAPNTATTRFRQRVHLVRGHAPPPLGASSHTDKMFDPRVAWPPSTSKRVKFSALPAPKTCAESPTAGATDV